MPRYKNTLATRYSITICIAAIVQINSEAQEVIQDNIQITTKQKQPIIRKGELSFGTFLGLCTGYLVKKVGKIFIGFIGATFIFLQASF
jgi:uncharacterized membrane protein (Fun14 family)